MPKERKKSGGKPSSKNSVRGTVDGEKAIVLKVSGELDEDVLEMATAIVGTLSGAFPLLKTEEALQHTYDSLLSGLSTEDLPILGEELIRLGESSSEACH